MAQITDDVNVKFATPLAGALEMTRRGLPVLPCNPDKSPRLKNWTTATVAPGAIEQWLSTGGTHYGIRTDDLTIIDVDVKRDAEQGIADYLGLGELPPTFTVLTPSGGFHKYFAGRSRKTKIGDCIDVQSGNGAQVIGPGSPGYRVLEDLPIAPLPAHLAELIGRPRGPTAPVDKTPMREPDQPDAMRDGWALVAATAGLAESEGKGRNATAHTLAGKLKRLGVSESAAVEMVTAWGAKCSPPLNDDEVRKPVGSSYTNGDWRIGQDRPDGEFSNIAADVAAIVGPTKGLVSRLASEITPEPIEWLWPNRFAIGKCALTAGDGDLGKTTVLLGMAATVTRGGDWPAGEGKAKLGSVLYFSTEDDAADTIVPRLMAAGADRSRVRLVTAVRRDDGKGERAFDLAADLVHLEAEIRRTADVRLVIFDPISAYFGRADTYRNSEVRAVLGPLADMAARNRVAIVGNTHFSKGGSGSANMRVLDSVAITAQARTVYIVIRDPEDDAKRMFLPSKGNLAPDTKGLRFHIEAVQVQQGIQGTRVLWEAGDVNRTADQLLAELAAKRKGPSALDDAATWLRDFLAAGAKPQAEVLDHGVASGMHAEKTLRRAAKFIGVVSRKAGLDDGWIWSLPTGGRKGATDPHSEFEAIDVGGVYDFG